MFKNICINIVQNKNMLMLMTVGFYILAIFFTLSNLLLPFLITIVICFSFSIAYNLFPIKHIVIWSLVICIGIANLSIKLKDVDELSSLAPINAKITGKILTIPQGQTEGKIKFFFSVDKIEFGSLIRDFNNEKVLVSINTSKSKNKNFLELAIQNNYILEGRLSNPFKAGNPSQFDYGNYLRNQNAYTVFYADDFKQLNEDLSRVSRIKQNISHYRDKILAIHSKYIKSPYLEILGGIVFGDDAVSPPKNIKQSFINSGLLHILAASGMNVAFIFTFFFMFMSIFKINFKLRTILGMTTVVIYSLMTGLGASVIRATVMLLFVMIGKLIDRDAHSISLLSFVALLMLIYNPLYINDVGFQLSFIVTFGILIMSPIFIKNSNKILNFIISTITIPIIAQLWVIPIQIFYFNNISIYSIFANIMSVPILMILSFGGFVSSLLSIITPIADLICKTFDFILNPLLTLLVNISDFWGKLPYSTIQTTHPSVFQIILYYIILLCITSIFYKDIKEKYFSKIKLILLFSIVLLGLTCIPIKNTDLEITAFDVGNADAFMIKTPSNEYLMVDTGKNGYNGGKSQAEIIVLKYLKDIGIKNLKFIIVSHFDNDHCGGTIDLIKNLKVESLYVTELNHNSFTAKNIYNTAIENNTQINKAENNQIIYNKNGLKLTNYMPPTRKTDNENSIITLLEYNGFKILFTGDSDTTAITSILKFLPEDITVLKVPHHGAINGLNKNLIDYFNPKYSIISVGENNFGHPSPLILELLKNSTILRTDIENAIKFKIKGSYLKLYTFNSNKKKWLQY